MLLRRRRARDDLRAEFLASRLRATSSGETGRLKKGVSASPEWHDVTSCKVTYLQGAILKNGRVNRRYINERLILVEKCPSISPVIKSGN